MIDQSQGNSNIQVEITDALEFHCFRLVLNPEGPPTFMCRTHLPRECDGTGPACVIQPPRIEIMLHARSLVDLIHKCSLALCDWQAQTSGYLLERLDSRREVPHG